MPSLSKYGTILFSSSRADHLVKDAGANDAFWGNGANNEGRNELGKALMVLRTNLMKNGGKFPKKQNIKLGE